MIQLVIDVAKFLLELLISATAAYIVAFVVAETAKIRDGPRAQQTPFFIKGGRYIPGSKFMAAVPKGIETVFMKALRDLLKFILKIPRTICEFLLVVFGGIIDLVFMIVWKLIPGLNLLKCPKPSKLFT